MSAVIVVLKPEQDRDEWMAAMQAAGLTFSEFSALDRIFLVDGVSLVTFPLVNHPGYASIEPADMPAKGAAQQDLVLDQALLTANWGIARMIRRRAPWPTNPGKFPQTTYYRCARDASGVDIYIIDTGIRTTHAEFGGRATNVYDASGAGPVHFHGTACASLAAGATIGTARAASIFSFQWSTNADGTGTAVGILNAINQALTHYNGRAGLNRPAVMNMSFVAGSTAVDTAVTEAINAGAVVVAAAGNENVDLSSAEVYPAESDADVIVVGATTACDIPYYWTTDGTNYGARLDISAPGQSNYHATNTGDAAYGTARGTSFACAFAAGAIACMLQGYPRLTSRTQVQAVRSHVRNTATTGKVRSTPQQVLPDRLLYLNPDLAFEAIAGL